MPLTASDSSPNVERPLFLHPAITLAAWGALGTLFALQEYVGMRSWGYPGNFPRILGAWAVHFFLWSLIYQGMWWKLRGAIRSAGLKSIFTRFVPLSLLISILEEALWVACFPAFPMRRSQWTYLRRLEYYVDSELINNLVIFWIIFFLFRGINYYQKYRAEEYAAIRLEAELAAAQMRALRMQLHPHFLFNTLNSISSLMRSDMEAADQMLERMSSMLRMTLDRGDAQLIRLAEEIEFIQLYLSIQQQRFPATVRHYIAIAPEVLDALVPTMILQPLVENAYVHGVSRTHGQAFVGIEAQDHRGQLRICIRNSGSGLHTHDCRDGREQVGLSNVRSRLELQYGTSQHFTLQEVSEGEVHAVILLPLFFAPRLNTGSLEEAYANESRDSG